MSIAIFIAASVGAVLGGGIMACFNANSYNKGFKDGKSSQSIHI